MNDVEEWSPIRLFAIRDKVESKVEQGENTVISLWFLVVSRGEIASPLGSSQSCGFYSILPSIGLEAVA